MDIGMDRSGTDAGMATIGSLFQHIVNEMKVCVCARERDLCLFYVQEQFAQSSDINKEVAPNILLHVTFWGYLEPFSRRIALTIAPPAPHRILEVAHRTMRIISLVQHPKKKRKTS